MTVKKHRPRRRKKAMIYLVLISRIDQNEKTDENVTALKTRQSTAIAASYSFNMTHTKKAFS